MTKTPVITLAAITLLYFSCSKSNNSDNGPKNITPAPIKIEIVSGSGQTDTIGHPLANSIVVKVTQSGQPLSGYVVQFQGSGCNKDDITTINTQADGTASFLWWLAGDSGTQTLKAYAVNAQNQKADSTSITATALATSGPGWHFAACTVPRAYSAAAICKGSTGRLFAVWNGAKAYLRYSDDNGISWNALTSLGNTHAFIGLLCSKTDELFAFAADGTYYSADAGKTWTNNGTIPFGGSTSAVCTPAGLLMVADQHSALYISKDKGKTWTTYGLTTFPGESSFNWPAEDANGNLYVVGQESGTLYKSADNGTTWVALPHTNQKVFAFYIDDNNNFYLSRSEPGTGGIYISKDGGSTYSLLTGYSNIFIDNMSVQSDGNFYYTYLQLGIYEAPGISAPVKRIFDYVNNFGEDAPYVVAKNGSMVTGEVAEAFIKYYVK